MYYQVMQGRPLEYVIWSWCIRVVWLKLTSVYYWFCIDYDRSSRLVESFSMKQCGLSDLLNVTTCVPGEAQTCYHNVNWNHIVQFLEQLQQMLECLNRLVGFYICTVLGNYCLPYLIWNDNIIYSPLNRFPFAWMLFQYHQ